MKKKNCKNLIHIFFSFLKAPLCIMSFQNAEHLISNRELGDSLEAIGIIILYLPSGGFFHFGISSLIDTSADRKRVFPSSDHPPPHSASFRNFSI